MLHVSTFGGLHITRARNVVQSLMQQPRRAALFTYLLISSKGGKGVSRDELMGMFWPDMDPDRASHALSQAVTFMRQSVGDVFTGKGSSEVGLRLDLVHCDAHQFEELIKHGKAAEALELYKGDFLHGFAPNEAEVEQWLELERAKWRRAAAAAASTHASECAARGDNVDAVNWARRASALNLSDEAEVRRLMALLHSLGDRSGAFEAYRLLERHLRVEYETSPSRETVEQFHLLRNEEKYVVDVAATQTTEGAGEQPVAAPLPTTTIPRRWRQIWFAPVGSMVLALAFIGLWGLRGSKGSETALDIPVVTIEDVRGEATVEAGAAPALTAELLKHFRGTPALLVRVPNFPEHRSRAGNFTLQVRLVTKGEGLSAFAVLVDAASGQALQEMEVALAGSPDAAAQAIVRSTRRAIGRRSDRERLASAAGPLAEDMIGAAFGELESADSLTAHGAGPVAEGRIARADSLLGEAGRISQNNGDLLALRADIAIDQMWLALLAHPPSITHARAAMARGESLSNAALTADPSNGRAHAARGTTRYWLALTLPNDSAATLRALLAGAESDLRKAVERDRWNSSAWSLLSALLWGNGAFEQAHFAAERAYSSDRYSEHTAEILGRLFSSALEIGDLPAAQKWCSEIGHAPGREFEWSYCSLTFVAYNSHPASDEAARIDFYLASAREDPRYQQLRMIAAVIHARRGRMTEARKLADNAFANSSADPEMLHLYAWANAWLRDGHKTRSLLAEYRRVRIVGTQGVLLSRRYREAL